MPEFLVEYVVTSFRLVRIEAKSKWEAIEIVEKYQEQNNYDTIKDKVIVTKIEED